MRDCRQHRIVVGVNGSRASLTALRWATAEARLRGAGLHVVRAWDPARHAAPYAAVGHLPTGDEQEAEVRASLVADMQAEFGPATPDDVTIELAEGAPERILIAESAGADLMVLGEAASPSHAGRSEGPVIRACLAHASCPVVIVGSANDTRSPAGRALADAVTA